MDIISVALVDDHAIMREGIRALIADCKDIRMVAEASSGHEAVMIADSVEPDLFIMDISMAEMDGLEATRIIKKNHPQIKILMLSQHDNKEYVKSAIKSGVDGFLPKTAQGEILITAIRSLSQGESFLYPSAARTLIQDYLSQVQDEPFERLTEREKRILKMIGEGLTSRDIALRMQISIKTVQGHRSRIMDKLDIHNQAALIKYAIRKGMVSLGT